ncbi:Lsm14 N-terminal [Kalmanozyma brasiliensis GHG001]|uniref:Uncharacterized protein n=1 Tax=Kalmanozyma brasiliensis (strain GHG001) TaxID=1365824 RepID=V5EXR7_KALBG|nr:Lsm14 N-terminal [Kalmanozyma brasiliensis GHG001]EST08358.1 Lsm14 N-terminal [Kalmanozyma brasiliensis GHG001]
MATAEYIGALISLISKSDIRYQGLLASINPGDATIALQNVRSWGTEGRVAAQGRQQEEIPPSDHVYDYIMFRAADVKDLKIDDPNPPKQQQAPPQPALNDPAILNSSAQGPGGYGPPAGMYGNTPTPPFGAVPFPGAPGFGPPPPQFNGGPGAPPQHSPAPPSQNKAAPAPAAKPASTPAEQPPASSATNEQSSADKVLEEMSRLSVSKSAQPASSPALPAGPHGLPAIPHAAAAAAKAAAHTERRTGSGAGGAAGGSRGHTNRRGNDVSGPSMPNREFDFESANAKFQKRKEDEPAEAVAPTNGGLLDSIPPPSSESPGSFYDKKSGFFDNISSEVKERYEGANREENVGGNGFFDVPGGRGRGGRGGGGRGRGRANRQAEEMKNMQTFGDSGANVGGGGRGGRGRGRGGRGGRGRGGPRGGGQGGGANGFANTGPMRMS